MEQQRGHWAGSPPAPSTTAESLGVEPGSTPQPARRVRAQRRALTPASTELGSFVDDATKPRSKQQGANIECETRPPGIRNLIPIQVTAASRRGLVQLAGARSGDRAGSIRGHNSLAWLVTQNAVLVGQSEPNVPDRSPRELHVVAEAERSGVRNQFYENMRRCRRAMWCSRSP
jgi:hypothetical protein